MKKTIILVMLSVTLFTGCFETSDNGKSSYDNYIALKVVCVEGLEAYRGYPAMYKRDMNDKLIPCDNTKFKK